MDRSRHLRGALQFVLYVGKVWPYILVGITIGAAIHGGVPQDFMASFMGKDAWWSVPLAVLLGVPMYTNAAGVIPIVRALLAKGAALGTVLVDARELDEAARVAFEAPGVPCMPMSELKQCLAQPMTPSS